MMPFFYYLLLGSLKLKDKSLLHFILQRADKQIDNGINLIYNLFDQMRTAVLFLVLVSAIFARNYPLYKQCDPKWGDHQLGTSKQTICTAGCLMCSAAMALSGTGHTHNPGSLNQWLKSHGGYVSGDLFVFDSIKPLGLHYQGKILNHQIKAQLDKGNVVIVNVHSGSHWALAHGYSGDNIFVNDPGHSGTTEYNLSQIVNGNTVYYKVG